ncbi:sensor histidine kinase [Nonomuraea sp. NPDC050663]|uniref:sensor histidine kinase n=1 Tax=Nonomuraea sp. NPDC050663 TaxID=3364370 RepID=UPI0037A18039
MDYRPPDVKPLVGFVFLGLAPAWDTALGAFQPAWLAWTVLAVAVGLYAALVLLAFAGRRRDALACLIALAAVVVGAGFAWGQEWFYLFPLVGLGCAMTAPPRLFSRVMFPFVALTGLLVWLDGGGLGEIMAFGWGTLGAGAVLAVILHLHETIAELKATREKLALAAVAEERLRFSRDLHDLLGHTLSVMVVKAEAVRRLATRDPAATAAQAADIEQLGRDALTQVRAAVTGYRGRGLAAELDSARHALADAGIDVTVTAPAVRHAPELDALLGWAVREGVTNVVRHSGAKHCLIRLSSGEDGTVLEIHDDGSGAPAHPSGHGLRGLAERVEAAGGTLRTSGDHGFLLRIELP